MDRSLAENSEAAIQLIPYVVLKCRDRYAAYRRGKEGTEARLRGFLSVGLGGHINPEDGDPGPICIERAMHRELNEELIISTQLPVPILRGLLYDPSTPVGRVHLGIVMLFRLSSQAVVPREAGKIVDLEWLTRSQLVERTEQLEPWSRIVVEGLL